MWILTGNEKSPGVTYSLICNRDILVGRRTDIKLEDDKSISRTHACLHVAYGPSDLTSPSSRGRVTLSDRSKYGTFVDGQRVEADQEVADGTSIRFGLQWNTWTLKWRPLTVVTSLVPSAEREPLASLLTELGATLLSDWSPDIDLLIMPTFKLSVKAVQALASGTPVVTPQYVRESVECWRSAASSPAIIPADFQPPLDEPSLDGSDVSIAVDARRKTLFEGKQFVFPEQAQFDRMRSPVELAGGIPVLYSDCGMTPTQLTQPGVIVMHTEAKSAELNRLRAMLKRKKLRMVQYQEIGLAVLRVSTERDCNPAFDYRATFLPPVASTQSQSVMGAVLAKETQPPEAPASKPAKAVPPASSASLTRSASRTGVVPPTPLTPGISLTPGSNRTGVVPPTPLTPSTSLTPGSSRTWVVPPTPLTPSTSLTPTSSRAGVVPPTPLTPSTSLTPGQTSGPAAAGLRSSPRRAGWDRGAESLTSPGSPGRRADSQSTCLSVSPGAGDSGEDGPQAKRARREGDGTAATESRPLETQDLLSSATARRPRDALDDESGPVFKRPRTSNTGRSARRSGDNDDPFDFELDSVATRPPPKLEPKREVVSPVPETLTLQSPSPAAPARPVKQEPADDGCWMRAGVAPTQGTSSDAAAAEDTRQEVKPKLEQLAAGGDVTDGVLGVCMRLQTVSLVCPRRPTPASAADDTAGAGGPDFKRFRRVRQPPLCPRIIGSSDLYVGTKRRSTFTNGHAEEPDEEERLRDESRRQEQDDLDLLRSLDSVGRAGRRR